jgi:hypothetical protein
MPAPSIAAYMLATTVAAHGTLGSISAALRATATATNTVSAWLIEPSAPKRYQVLAPDAVVHLGDNRLPAPWVPLFQDRNPSPEWRGITYVTDPGNATWQLTLLSMQSNFWSNRVWVNGQVLSEPLPLNDFSKSWISHTLTVPAGLLKPGPNEIRITLAHATPLIQDQGFGYDKLQFKDVVLWQ